ncbi:MAG TPA: hypothetical protein VM599_05410 [Thermoanaerobaculia bacterium]|nr:hypothetical protein [Thermoanaerobaculia bacterium]
MTRRPRSPLPAAAGLAAGLALAAWGLALTLPRLPTATPGYLARDLLPVILWGLLAIACLAGLVRLAIRPRRP